MPVEGIVFIIDDDPTQQEYLRRVVESAGLAGRSFADADRFLETDQNERPACLVAEARLSGRSGLDLLAMLRIRGNPIPAIITTAHSNVRLAVEAMKQGAVDFIEKPFPDQLILDSIQRALAQDRERVCVEGERRLLQGRYDRLSTREREVLSLVVDGHSNKQMASRLGLSQKTVEVHRAHVMKKMECASLAGLVRAAIAIRVEKG